MGDSAGGQISPPPQREKAAQRRIQGDDRRGGREGEDGTDGGVGLWDGILTPLWIRVFGGSVGNGSETARSRNPLTGASGFRSRETPQKVKIHIPRLSKSLPEGGRTPRPPCLRGVNSTHVGMVEVLLVNRLLARLATPTANDGIARELNW